MNVADLELVRELPLFRGLEAALLDRLLCDAAIERFSKGAILFTRGEHPEQLHILLNGNVEAFANDGGRKCAILIYSPADIIVPGAALVDEPHILSARALNHASLLSVPAAAIRAEIARCPALAGRLLTLLAGQFRVTLRHINDLKSRSGPQRLAAYLLWLIRERGQAGAAELPFPKGTLASRLDMTPETFSRALLTLADHGLVVRGHRATLRNRAAAERFCDPDSQIDGREQELRVRAW